MFFLKLDSGVNEGTLFPITPQPLIIGRDPECDVDVCDLATSRRHCEIHQGREFPQIRDLGSRNGTFLNNQRVKESRLKFGDIVRTGSTTYLITNVQALRVDPLQQATVDLKADSLENKSGGGGAKQSVAGDAHNALETLIGNGRWMTDLKEFLRIFAPEKIGILITGETGTGKEVIAQLLHRLSTRKDKPIVSLNCATIAEHLFESELFGFEKGAFTGAFEGKEGLMEASDGGTLFLDEVGDLSAENQARILRALETGRFRRVGGTREIEVNFRVLAATNRNLKSSSTFRSDLFYRLRGMELHVPPLRERREDILPLAEHFLAWRFSHSQVPSEGQCSAFHPHGFSRAAANLLLEYSWPGNVRELRQVVEAATALKQGRIIETRDLTAVCPAIETEAEAVAPLKEVIKIHLVRALEANHGNVTVAAGQLAIGRATFYRMLGRLGIVH